VKAVEVISNSARETRELGTRLGRVLKAGDVLALSGPLGSGKTVFVQGLAAGLGTDRGAPVTSPSFVILHEYPGPAPLYHFDFYRLRKEREVRELGYKEYFDGDGVCAVEWADKFRDLFGADTLWIAFSTEGEDARQIEFSPGPKLLNDRWPGMEAALKG
jgi:tRNA threonylcarbamoyladenosine biosynthesis protein TsaE